MITDDVWAGSLPGKLLSSCKVLNRQTDQTLGGNKHFEHAYMLTSENSKGNHYVC